MTGGCFSFIMGVVWHLAKRAIFLVITFILAIYATVVIANGGGRVDQILKDQIYTDLKQQYARNPAFQRLPPQEQARQFNISYNSIIEAQGLNEPFFPKSFRYTFNALQLNLGRATQLHSSDLSMRVSDIIFERLPRSLVLFTVANVVAAVFGIWLGLWMARKALSAFDRGMTVLSVTTFVVPPWVYGILFILIFAYVFKVFPAGGLTSVPPLPPSPLILAAAWTGAIITETVFQYPGLGLLFYEAISLFDAPVVIGLTTVYALLLVVTVFLLDVTYSLLDPRIKALRR